MRIRNCFQLCLRLTAQLFSDGRSTADQDTFRMECDISTSETPNFWVIAKPDSNQIASRSGESALIVTQRFPISGGMPLYQYIAKIAGKPTDRSDGGEKTCWTTDRSAMMTSQFLWPCPGPFSSHSSPP